MVEKIRKRRAIRRICSICKKRIKIRSYQHNFFFPQKICPNCEPRYEKYLMEAKELEPRPTANRCLVCDKIIKNGQLCEECFIDVGSICTYGFKAEIVEVWEIIKQRNRKYLKRKVKRIALVKQEGWNQEDATRPSV